MRRLLTALVILGAVGAAIFWVVTKPKITDITALAGIVPDLEQGGAVFIAGGCASCHAAPDAKDEARLELTGGRGFPSDFGTFFAPNISPHPSAGIGDWSALDLVNAMRHGTSPKGEHYFPAFPYTTYQNTTLADIVSLHAYLQTLPATDVASKPHDVGFPFNIRRSLGGWKLLFLRPGWVIQEAATPELERGRYLVEALGHCGECHTPRNLLGAVQSSRWMAGAPNPSGKGTIPNITPAKLDWSEQDLLYYFSSGFTPDFDTAGGHMTDVIENLSQMSEADLKAITAYIKALPAAE
ncbi:MAG: cytochrome c [Marinosulfonomonas sp.]|nr:cytochrome c [Marinosulfonomonas sp.]